MLTFLAHLAVTSDGGTAAGFSVMLCQKVAEAVQFAPNVKTVLEVDLVPYLSGLKKVIVPWIRPKNPKQHTADVKDFRAEAARMPADRLTFADRTDDHVAGDNGLWMHEGGRMDHGAVTVEFVEHALFAGA